MNTNRNRKLRLLENIFSITNTSDKKHKQLVIAGIKIKFKKSKKYFPRTAKTVIFENETAKNIAVKHRRAVCFASFNQNGEIDDNVILYLNELKKYADYIIFVTDNPIIPNELEKIKHLITYAQCEQHKEYDFGSYKRAYMYLCHSNLIENTDYIIFANDSCRYNGQSLNEIISESVKHDAYGLTIHSFGYAKRAEKDYYKLYKPHIQSYFVQVSSTIAKSYWFYGFMKSVKKEKDKHDVIINYEMGLSELLKSWGYKLNSFYPQSEENINPCEIYLNPNKETQPYRVFEKKYIINHRKGI